MAARRARLTQLIQFSDEIKERSGTSTYWEYEKFLGNGTFGVTVLLREMDRFVVRQKRIALKLARKSSRTGTIQLKRELEVLKKLRGAMHIVKMVASYDNSRSFSTSESKRREEESPSALKRIVDGLGKLVRLPPSAAFGPLEGLMDGPAVALEYLDKGDLVTLKIKTDSDHQNIPNRVLWSLFLCLIRACIGMAYPLERQEKSRSVLETIPTDGTRPSGIVHSDVAPRNIMIGSGDSLDEHHIGHLFKFIDFGSTVEYNPPRGPPENISDCGMLMFQMLDFEPISSFLVAWKGNMTKAGNVLPDEDDINDDPYPHIDLDLRDLIARCLYSNSQRRPTLQEALDEAERGVAKGPEDFLYPDDETDYAIREFFQIYTNNAPNNDFRV